MRVSLSQQQIGPASAEANITSVKAANSRLAKETAPFSRSGPLQVEKAVHEDG